MRRSFVVSLIPLALAATRTARADVVTDWNAKAVAVAKAAGASANVAPRALAILHIAIHNSLTAAKKNYEPYGASKLTVSEPTNLDVAAAAAAHEVLIQLFTSIPDGGVADASAIDARKQDIDAFYGSQIAAAADGPAKTNGVALGVAAAKEILAWRSTDKADAPNEVFKGSTAQGSWRPTPPGLLNGLEPQWRLVTPFALTAANQYRPPQPPVLQSAPYKAAFDEVKAFGEKNSSIRTAAQTEIANFWAQATHIPLNEIARNVSAKKGLGVSENARLFALLNIALADSRVAAWDAKYTYNAWRPITAINYVPPPPPSDAGTSDAQADGATPSDAAVESSTADDAGLDADLPEAEAGPAPWDSFLVTPNHPEYPSGHSTTGAAGIAVLDEIFGKTVDVFSVTSDTLAGVTKTFTKFDDVAAENGQSRIYGGIHFQYANGEGQTLGSKVGERAFNSLLRPVVDGGVLADGGDPGHLDAGTGVDGAKSDTGTGDDASTIDDASAIADAGAPDGANLDAAATADASEPAPEESSDCSCRLERTANNGYGAVALAGLAALVATRRRRSTRRR